jgi:uncharacterized membrane protein
MNPDLPRSRSLGRQILASLQRTFLSGLLVTVPVIITLVVLNFLFRTLDGLLNPLIKRFLGISIPGLGLIATIIVVLLAGLLMRNVVGSRLFGLGELLFVRTPLVRAVYSAAKQLIEAVASPDRKHFTRTVLIEYPRRGIYMVGFASGHTRLATEAVSGEMVAVYLPSTPTPVTGWVVLVPAAEIVPLDLTTEDAIKYAVSGGFATPPVIGQARPGLMEA